MVFSPGDTFIKRPTSGIPSHLWIVVSDPALDLEQVLIVNLTTSKPGSDVDPACVVLPGEHPFVRMESYVIYERANVTSTAHLSKAVGIGMLSGLFHKFGNVFYQAAFGAARRRV